MTLYKFTDANGTWTPGARAAAWTARTAQYRHLMQILGEEVT
jgi:hypothetical protein